MTSFEFESGIVLENVNVEYYTSGIPKLDDEGNIINAIIYFPTLKGGHSVLVRHHDLIKMHDFDKDEYFFIKITSLGTPNSCSPSSTGLKFNFPKYTFKDRVNFKRQFLAEKFKIKKILGMVGEGIGGFEVFTWACEYPEDMEFIIVLNASFRTYGYRYIFVKCAESIIESSEEFYSEGYNSSLSRLSVALFRLMFVGYFSSDIFENLSRDEIDALMDDYVDEGLFMDIHDFKARNDCIIEYDVGDKLQNIKAKSLILGSDGYLFFKLEEIFQLESLIENSKVVVFDSKKDYYEKDDYSEMIDNIISFLKQFKK